jgi:lysophospholipase L1-like esterase
MMPDLISEDPHTHDLTESKSLLDEAPWKRFAVLGDSAAAGVREQLDGYPDRCWYDWVSASLAEVQPDFTSRNFGGKGALTREVRAKQLPRAVEFAPDLAVLLCGGNDMLRGSLKGVEADFDQMLTPLAANGCTIITMSLFDITKSDRVPASHKAAVTQQLAPLNALIESIAARHGTVHLDFGVHPASVDENIYASDNMHLTARGHAVVAATVVRALSERT